MGNEKTNSRIEAEVSADYISNEAEIRFLRKGLPVQYKEKNYLVHSIPISLEKLKKRYSAFNDEVDNKNSETTKIVKFQPAIDNAKQMAFNYIERLHKEGKTKELSRLEIKATSSK